MEMEIAQIVGVVASVVTLLVLVGGGFYWWGRMSGRVDSLEKRVEELAGEVKELNGKIDTLRVELLTEIRRSEERIMTALAYHSHVAPDAGRAVFWQPIGASTPGYPPEAPAAPAAQPEAETPAV